jgi:salicylate hydroxylase
MRAARDGDRLTPPAPSVIIAGAGIGGLTAALAIVRQGIPVALFEQAEALEETGAGIQLSPNATRVLIGLGLTDRLAGAIVAPDAIRLRAARSGRDIAVMRLGTAAEAGYGAPYWVIHRADLQHALRKAVDSEPAITFTLGAKVEAFAPDAAGVTAKLLHRPPQGARIQGAAGDRADDRSDHRAAALIGADGLWSDLRARLGDPSFPRFAGRTAWRAVVPIARLDPRHAAPVVNLWLGPGGHLVHYPIRAGAAVNIVAVARDNWESNAWSTSSPPAEVLARFPAAAWAPAARDVLAAAQRFTKWALYDRTPALRWGDGPVTLMGDAAHPMLPFLAQGAGMAIEDAAVVAAELGRSPDDAASALRRYEALRQPRTARVQEAARRNDVRYHMGGPAAAIRNVVLRVMGGERLLTQYDWIYRWQP